MGSSALRKIQIGQESSAGTKVAATAKYLGVANYEEKILTHRPQEERGSLAGVHRQVKVGESVEITLEGDLTYEQILYVLASALENQTEADLDNPTFGKHDDNSVIDDLTNAIDGASGTSETIVAFTAAQDYILICAAAKFRGIKVDIGATPNALASTITAIECSDGATGWLAGTLVTDGTLSGGASMAQDGVIEFTPHASWASDTFDGDTGFWIRITWSADWTASTIINDFYTIDYDCTWTYQPNMTSANTPLSYTIEYGDDDQEHEAEYCVCKSFEIAGSVDNVLTLKSDWFGRNMEASTFTAALTDQTVESAVFNKTKLYIDNSGGSHGGTELAAHLLSYTLSVETGYTPRTHGGANVFFDRVAEKHKKFKLDMRLRFSSTTEAERVINAAGETVRLVRLETTGSTIDGSDTKKLTIDLAGAYTAFPGLGDDEGEGVVDVTIEDVYDSTFANIIKIAVTNEVVELD